MDMEHDEYSHKEYCFDCCFWLPKVNARLRQDPTCVVVNGNHYIIGEEDGSGAFRGHGGAKFIIRFKCGRQVVSHNLWYQGEIPALWRHILTDNATFVTEVASEGGDGLPF